MESIWEANATLFYTYYDIVCEYLFMVRMYEISGDHYLLIHSYMLMKGK